MWPWKRRERFSLDELRFLTEQLQRTTVVNEYNRDSVVETLRSIAELMIWGDQRDPSFFEHFMEKQVMVLFLHILELSPTTTAVAIQLLQSIGIMIQNIRSDHAIYYIFSNGYLNHFITYPFDFGDEELLAYYISFLRTTSTKLDQTTISFFIKTENDEVVSFPLYTEGIKFFRHEESMVRIAVRTLTLNVYHVNDKSVRNFVTSNKVVGYISDVVRFLKEKSRSLDDLVTIAERKPESTHIARLEGGMAETEEILDYCNDIVFAGIPDLARAMTDNLMHIYVVPLLCSLSSGSPFTSLYLLARVLHRIKHKPLANGIAAALVCETFLTKDQEVTSSRSRENGVATSCPMELVLDLVVSGNNKVIVIAVMFLLALLHTEVDESILEVLGLLPRQKQHRRRLLQTLMGSNSDEELLFASSPKEDNLDVCDYSALVAESEHTVIGKKLNICSDPENGSTESCSVKRMRMQEAVVKRLLEVICRRPPLTVEALWQCGALLWQIFPYHQEDSVHTMRLEMIRTAYLEAREALLKEVDDCWCDVIPSVVCDIWTTSRKALEGPQCLEGTNVVMMSTIKTKSPEDNLSSSAVAARMQGVLQVFVALHQLQQLLTGESIAHAPPLDWVSDGDPACKVGVEMNLSPEDALPCRIAFERGKERAVYLILMVKDISGWLLLAEENPSKLGRATVRVIAPLAGCLPELDDQHPKWLHLRIRPPELPTSEVSKSSRRIDGRWTLAFGSSESAVFAKQSVVKSMSIQRNAVKQVLKPLLGDSVS